MKYIKKDKLNILLKSSQDLFHTNDLVSLWEISNKNTLYTTIRRYVEKGFLIRIQKGFYFKIPLNQINPIRLGMAFLHSFSYLSTESILVKKGIILQEMNYITLISNRSKRFEIENYSYVSRKMKKEFLFNEFGVIKKNKIRKAILENMLANKLVAIKDRFKTRKTIAGRDVYDIHYFLSNGYDYNKKLIKERTNKEVIDYFEKLTLFIKEKVTQINIDQDLNFLLPSKKFNLIRKISKEETLMLLRNEIKNL